VILKPTPSYRWGTSLFLIAVAVGFLGLGIRDWMTHGYDLWFPTVLAAILIALAVLIWRMYIRVDDTAVIVRFAGTRRYDRREVASILIRGFEYRYANLAGRARTLFLRSDGSTLFGTNSAWWGKDQLEALATYLGVPTERS
jgi:hypothetical protein